MPDKFVIVELIPTTISPDTGDIVQLSALKIADLQLLDRFDYRLNEDKIKIKDLKEIINYDKDMFKYEDSSEKIFASFVNWLGDLPLFIIDNVYTRNYLSAISNPKISIADYLNLPLDDNFFDNIKRKYVIEPTNHLVDILYEAIIYKSNN